MFDLPSNRVSVVSTRLVHQVLAAALVAIGIAVATASLTATATAQATVSASREVSCLADNGRIDVWVTNAGSQLAEVTVSLTVLADRQREVAAGTTERITITGRPDRDYDLQVRTTQTVLLDETITVDCDPPAPEVSIAHSCLSDDGRVDVIITNPTRSELTYTVTIGTLAPRSATVAGESLGRVTATGRRDGALVVQVNRGGQLIATQTIDIACDALLPDGLDATLDSGCLGDNGFFRIDVANRGDAAVVFETAISGLAPRQRSVDAGKVARFMVTGRPDGRYDVTVRRGQTVVLERTDAIIVCDPIQNLVPEVLGISAHDRRAFTQGLLIDDGRLFESTGAPSGFTSSVRELDPVTGEVLRIEDFGTAFFGEGLASVGEELYFLSWLEGVVRVLDRDTFALDRTFTYDGQGWGLCFDGTDLVMSNGTAELTFRDPATFEVRRRVTVTRDGDPVIRLNELECVGNSVWANVWLTDDIIEIEPVSGLVRSVVDASGLQQPRPASGNAVLNGIAWDPAAQQWLVTGKEWPTLYAVRFTPAN